MLTTAQFLQTRQPNTNQFLPADHPAPTILVASHIWWTDFIALALHQLGYNVLLTAPLYLLYTDEAAWANFDSLYDQFLALAKQYKVSLILGGNSTALAPHRATGTLLHDAAGVPVVHYWWDEPRNCPPCMRHGGTPRQYLAHLRNPRTLNVWWDIDIKEEMAAFYDVGGVHVPLATTSDFWPDVYTPLEARRVVACFLGNCHTPAAHADNRADPLLGWANAVIDRKIANLDAPMNACLKSAAVPSAASPADPSPPAPASMDAPLDFVTGAPPPANIPAADLWNRAFLDWELLNLVYMRRTRNLIVQAVAAKWQDYFLLIGKGWDQMDLKAQQEHSGLPTAGNYYAATRASLNLFGGCVHGGMPLRPYEIAASHGLIVSHYNRELPDLYEPGRECLTFKSSDELNILIDRLMRAPQEYSAIVPAGRNRTLAHHTWQHRLQRVLQAVQEKFGPLK